VIPLSKEKILDAYSDVIMATNKAHTNVHLSKIRIAEIEKTVDEGFQAEICEKINQM
jgi:hypothetical protein